MTTYPITGWWLLAYGLLGIGFLLGASGGVYGAGRTLGYLMAEMAHHYEPNYNKEFWAQQEKDARAAGMFGLVVVVLGLGLMFLGGYVGDLYVW